MENDTLYNIEAEQALLGSLILDNNLADDIPDWFLPCHFSHELHKKIYELIRRDRDIGRPSDLITISASLQSDSVFQKSGGQKYVVDLIDAILGLSIERYAEIIHDLYLRRKLVLIGNETVANARNIMPGSEAADIIEQTDRRLFELGSSANTREPQSVFDFAGIFTESVFNRTDAMNGVNSGFTDLDAILGGFQKSDLIIIAGRPSMGKTAFATNIAFNAAKEKTTGKHDTTGTVFFSLEMSGEQLAARILANESEISFDNMRSGKIQKEKMEKLIEVKQSLEHMEFFIDDTPNITVAQMRQKVRRLKREHDIGLIVIDYLQLIGVSDIRKNDNRVNEISGITRDLKGLAKEMNVPVIVLSQLSRAVEQREDKKPQLADLRESGSIEQDADVVMFVYREAYYYARKEPANGTPEHDKWLERIEKINNLAEIIVAKQRNGPIGTAKLFFDGRLTRFGNLVGIN